LSERRGDAPILGRRRRDGRDQAPSSPPLLPQSVLAYLRDGLLRKRASRPATSSRSRWTSGSSRRRLSGTPAFPGGSRRVRAGRRRSCRSSTAGISGATRETIANTRERARAPVPRGLFGLALTRARPLGRDCGARDASRRGRWRPPGVLGRAGGGVRWRVDMTDDGSPEHAPLGGTVDHVRGGSAGRLIVEYGDYECPRARVARSGRSSVSRRGSGIAWCASRSAISR
jgi:hypothetical protein